MPQNEVRNIGPSGVTQLSDLSLLRDNGRLYDRLVLQKRLIPDRIRNSPHGSALIPYVVRGIIQYSRNRRLTSLQKLFLTPLIRAGYRHRVIRRWRSLPPELRQAFDPRYLDFNRGSAEIDDLLDKQLRNASSAMKKAVEADPATPYVWNGYRRIVFDPAYAYQVLKRKTLQAGQLVTLAQLPATGVLEPEPESPKKYLFRLEYRGLQVIAAHDRWGGVEPYMIAAFYQNGGTSGKLLELQEAFRVKHEPEQLGECKSNEWHPCGGKQDSAGNPSKPKGVYPKKVCTIDNAAILTETDSFVAVLSVWEEDGYQAEIAMKMFATLLKKVGSMLGGTGGDVLILIGWMVELATFLCDSADDPVGDIVWGFDASNLQALAQKGGPEIVRHTVMDMSLQDAIAEMKLQAALNPVYKSFADNNAPWPRNEWDLEFGVEAKETTGW